MRQESALISKGLADDRDALGDVQEPGSSERQHVTGADTAAS